MEQTTKSKKQPKVLQNKSDKLVVLKNDDPAILQQAAAKLPWGHHQLILDKVKHEQEKYFYIQKCIENS
ncbi:MAG: hypothetical protein IPO27_14035 [Bacteroidetes bacterium]|nr:hypothetical protein [Bacteroidota bacterium]